MFTRYQSRISPVESVFSAIYHVNMRRSILFSVMAPKRKAADVKENDFTDTEKYFTWTDEEVSLLLQIATAYKNEKTNEGKDWESIKSRYEDIQKLFCERYPKSTTEPELFPNVIDSAKVFNQGQNNCQDKTYENFLPKGCG